MIEIKNETNSAEIIISGDILDDSWKWDIDGIQDYNTYPSTIRDMLKDCNNKEVDVRINSLGGDIFAGFAISNILKSHNAKTTAIIDGIAASSASIIAFGCDNIKMPSNAYLMIHKPSCYVGGNADDFRKQADILDNIQTAIVDTYKSKSKITEEEVSKMIDDETWLKGSQAKEYFNVDITDEVTVKNCVSDIEYSNMPDELRVNKVEDEKQTTNINIDEIVEKVTNNVKDYLEKKEEEITNNTLIDEDKEKIIDSVFFNANILKGDD